MPHHLLDKFAAYNNRMEVNLKYMSNRRVYCTKQNCIFWVFGFHIGNYKFIGCLNRSKIIGGCYNYRVAVTNYLEFYGDE